MPYMTWNVWHRSDGARNWMDKTMFGGVPFTNIFYDGMRSVFYDENGKQGLLPQGAVYKASVDIVNNRNKGKRWGFTEKDQQTMLRDGIYKYNSSDWLGDGRLLVEGPDKGDSGYAKTVVNSSTIKLNFYNIINLANSSGADFTGLHVPKTATGAHELAFFTAGVMLHEMMHDHGFTHPNQNPPDHSAGSNYGCSLPYVAYLSVLFAAKTVLLNFDLPPQIIHPNIPGATPNSAAVMMDKMSTVDVD